MGMAVLYIATLCSFLGCVVVGNLATENQRPMPSEEGKASTLTDNDGGGMLTHIHHCACVHAWLVLGVDRGASHARCVTLWAVVCQL